MTRSAAFYIADCVGDPVGDLKNLSFGNFGTENSMLLLVQNSKLLDQPLFSPDF